MTTMNCLRMDRMSQFQFSDVDGLICRVPCELNWLSSVPVSSSETESVQTSIMKGGVQSAAQKSESKVGYRKDSAKGGTYQIWSHRIQRPARLGPPKCRCSICCLDLMIPHLSQSSSSFHFQIRVQTFKVEPLNVHNDEFNEYLNSISILGKKCVSAFTRRSVKNIDGTQWKPLINSM